MSHVLSVWGFQGAPEDIGSRVRVYTKRRYFCGRKCAVGRDRLHKGAVAERPEAGMRGWECSRGEGGDTGPRLHFPENRRFRSIRTEGAGLERRV
jgi:hypothetical protein